jgi:hypothetical protein
MIFVVCSLFLHCSWSFWFGDPHVGSPLTEEQNAQSRNRDAHSYLWCAISLFSLLNSNTLRDGVLFVVITDRFSLTSWGWLHEFDYSWDFFWPYIIFRRILVRYWNKWRGYRARNPQSRHSFGRRTWVIEDGCPVAWSLEVFDVEFKSVLVDAASNPPLGLMCLRWIPHWRILVEASWVVAWNRPWRGCQSFLIMVKCTL